MTANKAWGGLCCVSAGAFGTLALLSSREPAPISTAIGMAAVAIFYAVIGISFLRREW